MHLLVSGCFLLVLGAVYAADYGDNGTADPGIVRCYDCHYDPSQSRTTRYRRAGIYRPRGFPQCALNQKDDEWRVDRWPCKSKTCFVRNDHNGLTMETCKIANMSTNNGICV